jgi:Lrp/AsnC family transcriptional regulator for asnA, asnC and gidA
MGDTRRTLKGAVGLSEVDRQLIRLLRADGRQSVNALARALDVPQRQVRRRMSELSDAGVISITVVGDTDVFGYRSVGIVAMRAKGRPLVDIAADLVELDAVDYVNVTAGRFDLFAEIVARDLAELNAIVENAILTLPGMIAAELFPYRRLHYQEGTSDPPSPVVALQRTGPTIELDDLDRAIIAALSADGRAPLSHVATEVGTSETQVRRRLKRLTDAHAIRIIAVVNPLTHGYEAIARLAVVVAGGHPARAVAQRLAEVEAITYVAVCTGRYDVFCEVVCRDMAELDDVLDREIQSIDGIHRCETFVHLAPLHYRPLAPLKGDDGGA